MYMLEDIAVSIEDNSSEKNEIEVKQNLVDFHIYAINSLAKHAGEINKANGWHDPKTTILERICLAHSELSEACEAAREHDPKPDKDVPDLWNIEVELADAVIRILDIGYVHGYRVGEAIAKKLAFNETRGWRHGGKKH